MSAHSPTPWTPRRSEIFGSADIRDVFDAERREVRVMGFGLTGGAQASANADLIVRAVNAYDDMLAALHVVRMSKGWQYMAPETREIIDAALAKASPAQPAPDAEETRR